MHRIFFKRMAPESGTEALLHVSICGHRFISSVNAKLRNSLHGLSLSSLSLSQLKWEVTFLTFTLPLPPHLDPSNQSYGLSALASAQLITLPGGALPKLPPVSSPMQRKYRPRDVNLGKESKHNFMTPHIQLDDMTSSFISKIPKSKIMAPPVHLRCLIQSSWQCNVH